jgi:nitrate/nitrite transporter NarK
VRRRGAALGLATAGMSVSGVVLPYLAMLILESLSLEAAFLVIGLLVATLAPLAWRVIRISPESCGLLPDGDAAPAPEQAEDPEEAEWTTRQLLGSGAFWKLGAIYSLSMMGAVGVAYQLAPRFQDLGHDGRTAMLLTLVVAALATAGKFLWGLFCDLAEPRKMVALLLAAKAMGLGFGLWAHSPAGLWLFIVIFGFAMGGVMATFPIMAAHLFGRASFWQVYRLLVLFLALQGLGYLVMGQSFALTGSYDAAFACFIVLDLLACLLAWRLPRQGLDGRGSQGGNLAPCAPRASRRHLC